MQAYVFILSGRVQGVGFRWFAEREALKRNIRGYVRNLRDGRVEILAQADPAALDEFRERIRRGPSGASVEKLDSRPVEADSGLSSFRIEFQ
jgi:acylphosphatase